MGILDERAALSMDGRGGVRYAAPAVTYLPDMSLNGSGIPTDYRDVLYGGMYLDRNYGQIKDNRTSFGKSNAEATRQILARLYPDATPEQLDQAAYKAFTSSPVIQDEHTVGYKYKNYTPVDIVNRISQFMPELGQEQRTWLDSLAPTFTKSQQQQIDARVAERKAHTGAGSVLGHIGPIGQAAISLGVPGGAAVIGSLNASQGIRTGNDLQAGLGILGAGYGAYDFATTGMTPLEQLTTKYLTEPTFYDDWGVGSTASGDMAGAGFQTSIPTFGKIPGASVEEALAVPKIDTSLGTGLYGQDSAITQALNGQDYVSPLASGSITGVQGMTPITTSALGEVAAQTGLNTNGLQLSSGTGGEANVSSNVGENLAKAAKIANSAMKVASLLGGEEGQGGGGLLGMGGGATSTPINLPYFLNPKMYGLLNATS